MNLSHKLREAVRERLQRIEQNATTTANAATARSLREQLATLFADANDGELMLSAVPIAVATVLFAELPLVLVLSLNSNLQNDSLCRELSLQHRFWLSRTEQRVLCVLAAVLQLMELNAWQRFRDSPLHEEFVRSQQTTQTTHLTPADRLRVQVDDALSREPGMRELFEVVSSRFCYDQASKTSRSSCRRRRRAKRTRSRAGNRLALSKRINSSRSNNRSTHVSRARRNKRV